MMTADLQNGSPRKVSMGKCARCNVEFVKNIARHKYCSQECYRLHHNERARVKAAATRTLEVVTRECERCRVTFSFTPHINGTRTRFCSKRCGSLQSQDLRRGELAERKAGFEACDSCGIDCRLIESNTVSCWLRSCPARPAPVDEKQLDAFARKLACAGLQSHEQIEASTDVGNHE